MWFAIPVWAAAFEGYRLVASPFFSVAKKDSVKALSQQLALRRMLGTKPSILSVRRKSPLAYWLPLPLKQRPLWPW